VFHHRLSEHGHLEARLVSGFRRTNDDGTATLVNGRLALFRNFDEGTGNALPRPNTLLIDSEQLEAGDALDANFRSMAADEIQRFKREIVERSGDARAGDNITDQELLREVMDTVGKPGQLGGAIRCVVSVSMLTEGWDANTVTHFLGIRAFGTQLLWQDDRGGNNGIEPCRKSSRSLRASRSSCSWSAGRRCY
jgi:type III restriction enzyme